MSLDDFYPHLVQMLQIYLYYCEPTNYFNKRRKLRTINSEQDRNAIITAALLCIDKCLDLNSFLSAIVYSNISPSFMKGASDLNIIKSNIKDSIQNSLLDNEDLNFIMKLILYILPTLNKNECEDIIDILDPFIKRALENNVENAKILPKKI